MSIRRILEHEAIDEEENLLVQNKSEPIFSQTENLRVLYLAQIRAKLEILLSGNRR